MFSWGIEVFIEVFMFSWGKKIRKLSSFRNCGIIPIVSIK